jgi:hypothetical protein
MGLSREGRADEVRQRSVQAAWLLSRQFRSDETIGAGGEQRRITQR